MADRISAMDRLNSEIGAFDRYMHPSADEAAAATSAVTDLKRCIRTLQKDIRLDVVGSRATGLARPFSDIDVLVTVPKTHPWLLESDHDIDDASRILAPLWSRFVSADYAGAIGGILQPEVFLRDARVPLIQLQHSSTGLSLQLTCEIGTHASDDQTRDHLREYPMLRSLFAILKHMLEMRGFMKAPKGGLGSYPLVNLIVAALRTAEHRAIPQSPASQLLHFLDLYSDMDFRQTTISTIDPDVIQRHVTSPNRKEKSPMRLLDPADTSNNLGKYVWSINDIQSLFASVRYRLKSKMQLWDEGLRHVSRGDNRQVESLLGPLVGGDYHIFEHDRRDLRRSTKKN